MPDLPLMLIRTVLAWEHKCSSFDQSFGTCLSVTLTGFYTLRIRFYGCLQAYRDLWGSYPVLVHPFVYINASNNWHLGWLSQPKVKGTFTRYICLSVCSSSPTELGPAGLWKTMQNSPWHLHVALWLAPCFLHQEQQQVRLSCGVATSSSPVCTVSITRLPQGTHLG